MLQPARSKYRKEQKGRNKGIATRGNKVSFGEYGLKAIGRGRLTARQIEAARRAMTRHIKRGGRIWIRIFPDKPVSQKPAEVRMGNGKGNPEYYVAEIRAGQGAVRDGWRRRGAGARGVRARRGQAADPDDIRPSTARRLGEEDTMKTSERRKDLSAKSPEELQERAERAAQRAVRPAHAEGDPAAHQHSKLTRRPPRHRPGANAAAPEGEDRS